MKQKEKNRYERPAIEVENVKAETELMASSVMGGDAYQIDVYDDEETEDQI